MIRMYMYFDHQHAGIRKWLEQLRLTTTLDFTKDNRYASLTHLLPGLKAKMLKKRNSSIIYLEKGVDIGITVFSFTAACFIKKNLLPENLDGLPGKPTITDLLLLITVIWSISYSWTGLYLSYRRKPFSQFFIAILKSNLMGMMLVTLLLYLLHIQDVSRLLIGIFLVVNISLLSLLKFTIFKLLGKIRTGEDTIRNIVIVGSQQQAKELIEVVEKTKTTGYKILGCFDVDEMNLGTSVFNRHKVIGLVQDLEIYLQHHIVDDLIVAMPLSKLTKGNCPITLAENLGINVHIFPDVELQSLANRPGIATIQLEDFLGIPSMSLQSTPRNEGALLIKNLFDFLAAFLLVIVLLPLFLAISLAIKIISEGSIFYRQERLGMNGRRFIMYKFRTMVSDADERVKELLEMNEADGPVFKIKNDPRIIPYVGTFLRKSGLDELPQLLNVLKNEMSLVGPRPPIPKEVDNYSVWHRRRLSMKPGMTCLWQIRPDRNELSFEEWMKLDLKYIDNWSLFLDFQIMVCTIKTVLAGTGR